MFKKRALQVKMVKTNDPIIDTPTIVSDMDPDKLAEIYKDVLKHTTICVVTMVAGNYILKSTCDIAKIYASK